MNRLPWLHPDRVALLEDALAARILVIDGAMGTMIQRHGLEEADYRGERFAEGYDALFAPDGHAHGAGCGCEGHDQRGNNDLLTLTRPGLIRDIHAAYLAAGADLVETVFDTLNAQAALFAIEEAFDARGARLPVMVSGTITDASGRTLSGQTAEAFWYSVRHAQPLAIGLNCALGAKDLRAHVDVLSCVADAFVSTHPNAGLPNAFGGYDETPEDMAATLREFAEGGLLNLVGGCCGTTPDHIAAIAEAVGGVPPRQVPRLEEAA